MSDTHAQTVSYVRETMIEEQTPPVGQTGIIKWARENLLSSWLNIVLTVISVYVLYYLLSGIMPRLLNSIWNAGSLTECREVFAANSNHPEYMEGICWGVIRDRWVQLLMGTYPPAYFWRSGVAILWLFVGLAPVLFPERTPKLLLIATVTFPFAMPWLLWGGSFWIPVLYFAGFGVGYLAYVFGARAVNSLLGVILAIVAAIVWWLVATPAISDGLHRIIAEGRMDSAKIENAERAEVLSAELEVIEAEQELLAAEITAATEAKDILIADIRTERFRRQIGAELPDVIDHLEAALAGGFTDAAAEVRHVRDILTPFNPDFASAELSVLISDLRNAVRNNNPIGEAPEEGDALPPEATEILQGYLATAEDALGFAERSGLPDAELDAMVEDFNTQINALTDLREQATSLGSDQFRRDEQRRISSTLVRNIERLQANQTALPELRETALSMRAGLPDIVANIFTIPENRSLLDEAITDEQIEALEETLAAERAVRVAEQSITGTYDQVGRVGLAPVGSEQFGGFQLSLVIGVIGIVMSLPLGILLALGRQSDLLIINKSSVVFIEVIRGVPLIVWLMVANFLLNFFLPPGTEFDKILRVIIMVTLFSSAYIAEVVRGGLAALPKGQYEAADALGLDYWKSMRLIVLPQALKISIPGIVNTFIGLFKDTVLVIFIGLTDPLGIVNQIRSDTDWNGIYWELFIFVGLLFFAFCFFMGRYSLFLERKLQRENR